MPLMQNGEISYGALPLMSEAMEMQHNQFLSQGFLNEYGANTAAFSHPAPQMAPTSRQVNHMDMGIDGRRDLYALKFLDEHAAKSDG